MNTTLSICFLSLAWEGYFYHVDNPKSFQVYYPREHVLSLPGSQGIKPKSIKLKSNQIDLDAVAPKGMDRAVLTTTIHSETNRTAWLGIGCKVFEVACNGKTVYSFLNKGLGNDYFPVSTNDHIFPVELKKGDNVLVIQTYKTNWMLDFCYGEKRENPWIFAIAEHPDYKPVQGKLSHPAFFSRPSEDTLSVTIITEQPMAVGIDLRPRGSTKWQRTWDLAGDLVLREKSRVHCFKVDGLIPKKDYEYRIVLLEPPIGKQGFRRALWSPYSCKEIVAETGVYHAPKNKTLRFFMFGDTQLSLDMHCQTPADLEKYMKKLRSTPAYKAADFIIHAGDVASYFHNVEQTAFTEFFDHFAMPGAPVRPWVYLRGNHECNGLAAETWFNYFLPSGEKSYYAFRYGETLFIVLDCADFPDDPTQTSSGPLIYRANLMQKQKAWLKQLKTTPEFKNARFRLILAHAEPFILRENIIKDTYSLTADLLADTSPSGMIHLWLAGHTHYYWRMNRGATRVVTNKGVKPPKTNGKPAPVTFLTMDAPKGTGKSIPMFSYYDITIDNEAISVDVCNDDAQLLDAFTIDRSGKVTEKGH